MYFVVLLEFDARYLRTQIRRELTGIEVAHDDAFVSAQHLTGVTRKRADIIELREGAVELVGGSMQMSLRATPSYEQGIAFGIALYLEVGYPVRYLRYLRLTRTNHHFVILGVGRDSTSLCVTLETDVTMLVSLHAGESPVAHAAFVTQGRVELSFEFLRHALRMDSGQFCHFGYAPECRSVRQIGIREQNDRCHVLQRQTACFVGEVKAVSATRCRENNRRTLAVTAVERLQQVGLFGFGRQTGGRTTALHIDDDERQLCHNRQTDGFGLEAQTGTAGRGTSEVTGESRTYSGAYTGYLVLRLHSHDVLVLAACQLMQDIGCRRDRIRTEEETFACFLGSSYQSPCRRFVAGDRGVGTVRLVRMAVQMNLGDIERKVLTVVIAIDHHFGVRSDERGFLFEFVLQQVNRLVHRFIEQPADEAQGEHVTALEDGFVVHAGFRQGLFGERRQRHGHYLHGLGDAEFRERIVRMVLRFLQVFVRQRVRIDDDDGMAVKERELILELRLGMVEMRTQGTHFQCRGIHRDDDIRFVAGRIDA